MSESSTRTQGTICVTYIVTAPGKSWEALRSRIHDQYFFSSRIELVRTANHARRKAIFHFISAGV
jgi:hypothetical protein